VVEDTSEWATGWDLVGGSVSSVEGCALEWDRDMPPGRVPPMRGVGPGMGCPTAIPPEGTDPGRHMPARAWLIPMGGNNTKKRSA
jgi:hypothetical protein